jgi:hypothetical protein
MRLARQRVQNSRSEPHNELKLEPRAELDLSRNADAGKEPNGLFELHTPGVLLITGSKVRRVKDVEDLSKEANPAGRPKR